MSGSIKSKLELIKDAADDVRARIDELLAKNDRIELATTNTGPYEQDLYRLMKEMADVANPVLMKMGLDKEAITGDIEEFVKILGDNREEEYFASVNIDAKYSKNRYTLSNLQNWLQRLEDSITKILDFMDSESEKSELEGLFKIIDSSRLTKAEKETLKNEFTTVLNRIKCR